MIRNDILLFEDGFGDDLLVDASDGDCVTITITEFFDSMTASVSEVSLGKEDCLALAAFLKEKVEGMEKKEVSF